MADTVMNEFWLDPTLDPEEFKRAVEKHFTGASVKFGKMLPGAQPDHMPNGTNRFEINLPRQRMHEWNDFTRDYADKHFAITQNGIASGFGWSHSG